MSGSPKTVAFDFDGGQRATLEWLDRHGIYADEVTSVKPHALLYVDDRGYRFSGSWTELKEYAETRCTPRPWIAPAPAAASASWAGREMPKCGTCGVEVDDVRAGRYLVCGHAVPGHKPTRIEVSPDAPAVLAARLVRRLERDLLIDAGREAWMRLRAAEITEALADEIHQATVDGTLGGGS